MYCAVCTLLCSGAGEECTLGKRRLLAFERPCLSAVLVLYRSLTPRVEMCCVIDVLGQLSSFATVQYLDPMMFSRRRPIFAGTS